MTRLPVLFDTYGKPNGLTRAEARENAKRVLVLMRGAKWSIDVWENMGWHSCIYRGTLRLYWSTHRGKTTYSCLLNSQYNGGPGGDMFWTVRKEFRDPNRAVEAQIREAVRHIVECRNAVMRAIDPRSVTPRPGRLTAKTTANLLPYSHVA